MPDEEFTLPPKLPVPRAVTFSTQTIYERIKQGKLVLDPQRDRIWSEQMQSDLIDSIFRHVMVPPIVLVNEASDDGSGERHVCLDGSQRIFCVKRFLEGDVPYIDASDGRKYWYKVNYTERKNLLPEKYRIKFASMIMVCVEYSGLDDGNRQLVKKRLRLISPAYPVEHSQTLEASDSESVEDVEPQKPSSFWPF